MSSFLLFSHSSFSNEKVKEKAYKSNKEEDVKEKEIDSSEDTSEKEKKTIVLSEKARENQAMEEKNRLQDLIRIVQEKLKMQRKKKKRKINIKKTEKKTV